MSYSLYVIQSKRSFDEIVKIISKNLDHKVIGLEHMKVMYRFNKNNELIDTYNTLIFLEKEDFEELQRAFLDITNYDRLRINNYNVGELPQDRTDSLFLEIPQEFSVNQCKEVIVDYIHSFSRFSLLNDEDFSISIPLLDRENNVHKNFAFINFKDSVSFEKKSYTKVLLNSAEIFEGYNSKCSWVKVNLKMKKSNKKKKSKELRD